MTPKQRQALTESLAHWDENVRLTEKGEDPKIGWQLCACCSNWLLLDCDGCPVKIVTGAIMCDGTWYWDIANALTDRIDTTVFCRLERDWLKLILDSEVDENG